MIPEHLVDEVRTRADIVEVIGEIVPLKRAGKDFRALCPFHHEKTPSFYVVPAKGFYKCFGCGESGDVFTFLMKRTGIGFTDAVREIAKRVGVDLPAPGDARPSDEPHRALHAAISFAVDFFVEQLAGQAGEAARGYLDGRGITADAVQRFAIGYAPGGWRTLREAAHRHGIEDDVLLTAGLIKESERSEEPYDRFRDRIIFPIAEVTGRSVAFGGRALRRSENVPKYLNSPETPIYQKGHILYGLNWSKPAIRREGATLVVEGYMDYVSLAARGIENVVAGMGTALTPEQANLIARYTAKAYLLYDSDVAGLRATFRTADALLRAGVHPLVVTLPAGEDPDSLVRKQSADALRPLLDRSVDVIDRKIEILDERGYFADIEGARRALDGLIPTIRATIDPALRDIYISRVAERTGVRPETIEHDVRSSTASPDPGVARRSTHRRDGERRDVAAPDPFAEDAEHALLLMMVKDPPRVPVAASIIDPELLRNPIHRALFDALVHADAHGVAVDPTTLDAPVARRYTTLHDDRIEITDGNRTFDDAVAEIRARPLWDRLDEIEQALRDADEQHGTELLRERRELQQQLNQLRQVISFKSSRRYRMYARERVKPRPPATRDE